MLRLALALRMVNKLISSLILININIKIKLIETLAHYYFPWVLLANNFANNA